MPDAEKLLNTLRRATEAMGATPGRRGHLIDLQDATDVLVAGDLHGNVENLRRILDRAQLAKNPGRHLVLQELVHGPHRYPAGGDKSHQLVDLFAALKCQFPKQMHYLLGNHELSQWTARAIAKGDVDYNAIFREGIGTAYGAHGSQVYDAYFQIFAALPLAIRTSNHVLLSHSLPYASKRAAVTIGAVEHDPWEPADLVPGGVAHAVGSQGALPKSSTSRPSWMSSTPSFPQFQPHPLPRRLCDAPTRKQTHSVRGPQISQPVGCFYFRPIEW